MTEEELNKAGEEHECFEYHCCFDQLGTNALIAEIRRLQAENARLKEENDELTGQVADLSVDLYDVSNPDVTREMVEKAVDRPGVDSCWNCSAISASNACVFHECTAESCFCNEEKRVADEVNP